MRELTKSEIEVIHFNLIETLKKIQQWYMWEGSEDPAASSITAKNNKELGRSVESFSAYIRELGDSKEDKQ